MRFYNFRSARDPGTNQEREIDVHTLFICVATENTQIERFPRFETI